MLLVDAITTTCVSRCQMLRGEVSSLANGVDAFWSTLHSSKSADAMHYTDTEYDQIFHKILRQISLHAGTCRDYRKDLLAQNRSSCPGKFSHAVQHGVRSGTSDGIGFGIDPTCSLTWFDPRLLVNVFQQPMSLFTR